MSVFLEGMCECMRERERERERERDLQGKGGLDMKEGADE